LEKLKIAEQFAALSGTKIMNTNFRLARHTIFSRMAAASREWDEVVSRYKFSEGRRECTEFVPEKVEGDLAAWLESTNIEGGTRVVERVHTMHQKAHPDDIELYRCSWCGNPSAAMRKCSSCGNTRYCDTNCQKEHWSTHKKACRRKGKLA